MGSFFDALKAQPDFPVTYADPTEIEPRYRYWRRRIMITSILGYAAFYFVRTNIGQALPAMGRELHLNKASQGIILSVGMGIYGVSKFLNGFLGDRANPRYFMAFGLFVCALMNVAFGLTSGFLLLCAFWFMNNWAQGMGFPPCARNLGYWFSPRERSTSFGVWNSGHMIGGALVAALTGHLVTHGWRLCFFVPAGIALAGAVLIVTRLRDTPGSLGLPPVEVFKGEETPRELAAETHQGLSYRRFVIEYVFKNKFIWIVSIANFFVYTLRYAGVNWGPTLLQEMKHLSPAASGYMVTAFEMSGLVGGLLAGWLTDRYFRGCAARVCVVAMLAMLGVTYLFQHAPPSMTWLIVGCFMMMGFFVYVPQMLIAAIAMNLSTKRAGAAAVGLTGIFGYASTVASGWGIGRIADVYGWNGPFGMLLGCCIATAVLLAFTWNIGGHPQLERPSAFPVVQKQDEVALAK